MLSFSFNRLFPQTFSLANKQRSVLCFTASAPSRSPFGLVKHRSTVNRRAMAFYSLKLNTTSLPRVATGKEYSIRTRASLEFERGAPKVSLNSGSKMSRRDALSCVTSTLLLTSFVQTEPADARIAKPEIRRKIMEKLEQLRQKAGLGSKGRTDPKEEKKLSKLENEDEKKLPKVEKKEPTPSF